MKRPFLYDPVKHLRGKGVTVRKVDQNGEAMLKLVFNQYYSWTPQNVLYMRKLAQDSRALILMQLNVDEGMPPRSIESLLAKDYIRIVYDSQDRKRYVITERGKLWMRNVAR